MMYPTSFDVIVCGAGHAGCEAALAAARMGCKTLVLTGNLDTIAQMSCNPAIGGPARGQMLREMDALGGVMGLIADHTSIQHRLLNESKGAAVQTPRVQCDKKAYQFGMKLYMEQQPNITLFQATVTTLLFADATKKKVVGVDTNLDIQFSAKTVVVTTGTFLRGLMHVGQNKNEGGRMGDFSAKQLSGSFLEAGIELRRFKTGTPPRLLGRTINFEGLVSQESMETPVPFCGISRQEDLMSSSVPSFPGWKLGSVKMKCWHTNTTAKTAQIIRDNLHRSPLYCGDIKGTGPRYCPSIEDKIVKFTTKDSHTLYLEPEGRHTEEFYINGLSTSLLFDVQIELIHSIPGLENAHILRPAYAVEYDYAPPTQLYPHFESKIVDSLFFAGQINGSSGYEEAAAQGLIAGINAALKATEKAPLVISRAHGYLGVLADDLSTKGVTEPYRMLTSRAENRLSFNFTSSEYRMLNYTSAIPGLIPVDRLDRIKANEATILADTARLESTRPNGSTATYAEICRQDHAAAPTVELSAETDIREEVLYRCRYKGYIEREQRSIAKLVNADVVRIPVDFDYTQVKGLGTEAKHLLTKNKPFSLGQASRIAGVNPSDITLLMIILHKRNAST